MRILKAALFLFPLLISMNRISPAFETPPPTVDVSGEGEVKIEPDQAILRFGIETFGPRLKEVQNENAKRTQALLAALKARGVKSGDIQTDLLQINPRYDFDKTKRKFVEYTARKNFTVTLNDLTTYGAVLEAALDAGVDSVEGLQFQSSKMKNLKDEARKAAMIDAKRRAELLAGAVGQSVGKALRIQEQVTDFPQPVMMQRVALKSFAGGQTEDAVAPGEVAVRSTVQVQFELK